MCTHKCLVNKKVIAYAITKCHYKFSLIPQIWMGVKLSMALEITSEKCATNSTNEAFKKLTKKISKIETSNPIT